MKKNITLKEIARELRVSVSTVSKALRDNDEISLETRQRIQAVAKLYHYKPNSIALSLRNQSTRSIAIIIPQIVNQFFTEVIKGIEAEASKHNYNTIIAVSNDSFEKEVLNMQTLANGSIDGFILSVAKGTLYQKDFRHFQETIEQGVPIVMIDRKVDEVPCDKVIIDDRKGAQKATEYLLTHGCKKIVLITTEDFISVGRLRKEGYCRALQQQNITEVNETLIISISDRLTPDEIEQFINQRLDQLMQLHPDIDGLIGVNELYTICAANYFKEKNYKIPEQVSLIAFSDGDLPKYAYPSITAVSQRGTQMGKTAAQLLLDKLQKKTSEEQYQTLIIETELIERNSTKK